jgi:chromosome segregation ATPase
MLNKRNDECKEYKRTLVLLEADWLDDPSLVDRFDDDREGDAHSFQKLKERAEAALRQLRASLEDEDRREGDLQVRRRECLNALEKKHSDVKNLREQRGVLDAQVAELQLMQKDRDHHARNERELRQRIEAELWQVNQLQSELTTPNSAGRWGSELLHEPHTISFGQESLHRRDRLEGCRRNCSLM